MLLTYLAVSNNLMESFFKATSNLDSLRSCFSGKKCSGAFQILLIILFIKKKNSLINFSYCYISTKITLPYEWKWCFTTDFNWRQESAYFIQIQSRCFSICYIDCSQGIVLKRPFTHSNILMLQFQQHRETRMFFSSAESRRNTLL